MTFLWLYKVNLGVDVLTVVPFLVTTSQNPEFVSRYRNSATLGGADKYSTISWNTLREHAHGFGVERLLLWGVSIKIEMEVMIWSILEPPGFDRD